MALTGLLHANITMASSGMQTARSLAKVGDDALPLLSGVLDGVASSLGALAGHEAQVLIGPRVNFASEAMLSVRALARAADAGRMPSEPMFAAANAAVRQAATSILALL